MYMFLLAGGLGFEPRQAESESAVLPLDDPPRPRGHAELQCGAYNSSPPGSQARGASAAGLARFVLETSSRTTRRYFRGTHAESRDGRIDGRQQLGPVLEMHGVVVIPAAAPDEAVPFERAHDLVGNVIPVGQVAVGA